MARRTYLALLGALVCASPAFAGNKPPVRWIPANPRFYTKGRSGQPIKYVVIHTIEGSAQSGINTFKNNTDRVSAHYIVDFDGTITQMVHDRDKAWHVGKINRWAIGIEHAGWSGRNRWTQAQYRASANLTRYLCDTYGIPKDRQHIIGHVEAPGATHNDPGKFFDWDLYMKLVRGEDENQIVSKPLRPAAGEVLGKSRVPLIIGNGERSGLTVEWTSEGNEQVGARVLVNGPGVDYDSGYLPGKATKHVVNARFQNRQTYRWKALVTDGNKTVASDWVPFKTDFTEPEVTALSPIGGAEVADTPVLRWRYEDPDGGKQVGYRVQVDDNQDHQKLIADTKELNGTTHHYFLRNTLTPDKTYYWRAMGHDGHGNVVYTPWQTFRTGKDFKNTLSGGLTVAIRSPHDGAIVPTQPRVVLRWSYHNGQQREQKAFRVQLDDDQDGSSYLLDQGYENPAARGFRPKQLKEGSYRWRVGVTDGEETAWTGWSTFSVGDAPKGPGITSVLAHAADDKPLEKTKPAEDAKTSQSDQTNQTDKTKTPTTALASAKDAQTANTGTTTTPNTGPTDAPQALANTTLPASLSQGGQQLGKTAPEAAQLQSEPAPEPQLPAWAGLHDGLTLEGAQIPRQGLSNKTLRRALGIATEPQGATRSLESRDFVAGRASWFGGPRARGRTALSGESLNRLNNPLRPSTSLLQSDPERYYFVAMRWDYSAQGGRWWSRQRLLVVNPKTGRSVVVRPVDWGPHTKTGRVMNLSPQALIDLGARTDDELLIAFAVPGTSLGPK